MISAKRCLNALKLVMLLSAAVHLILLAVIAILERDVTVWNYFNILDLEYFFPAIIHGGASQIASVITMAALLVGAYVFFTKE